MSMFGTFSVAALAALLPISAQVATGHTMGGGPGANTGFSMAHGSFHQAPFHDHRSFDHHRFFFRHRRPIFVDFDFVAFGLPWWYPEYYYYGYPADYGYADSDSGPDPDYHYWNDLAVSVQTALVRRGYYRGPISGVVSPSGREAIRAFQAAEGLPVTGVIDPKLLNALGIPYRRSQG